jgi:hypothetical protein
MFNRLGIRIFCTSLVSSSGTASSELNVVLLCGRVLVGLVGVAADMLKKGFSKGQNTEGVTTRNIF